MKGLEKFYDSRPIGGADPGQKITGDREALGRNSLWLSVTHLIQKFGQDFTQRIEQLRLLAGNLFRLLKAHMEVSHLGRSQNCANDDTNTRRDGTHRDKTQNKQ